MWACETSSRFTLAPVTVEKDSVGPRPTASPNQGNSRASNIYPVQKEELAQMRVTRHVTIARLTATRSRDRSFLRSRDISRTQTRRPSEPTAESLADCRYAHPRFPTEGFLFAVTNRFCRACGGQYPDLLGFSQFSAENAQGEQSGASLRCVRRQIVMILYNLVPTVQPEFFDRWGAILLGYGLTTS